jgi:hypothetical protein
MTDFVNGQSRIQPHRFHRDRGFPWMDRQALGKSDGDCDFLRRKSEARVYGQTRGA